MKLSGGVLCLVLLAACSGVAKDPYADWSAKDIYDSARSAMNAGEFGEAVKLFEALEARYPFGRYALQTQLDIAYAYYKFDEMESAIAAADRFIKFNPRHERVDYAYYLKGLAYFNRGRAFFESLAPREFASVDQSQLRDSYRAFDDLLRKFPDSKYAADARQRMVYLRNKQAEHEYLVASYYFRRGAFAGAVNRVKYLINHMDGAPVVPEALVLMVKAY
ncbi:MAG: outer membrane protein assembly factor BamD, partial [Gammaproteobacteria bacterium]|nr:outer membrane protein assembly factor BamD [Gammaproteobacteria bacterium]